MNARERATQALRAARPGEAPSGLAGRVFFKQVGSGLNKTTGFLESGYTHSGSPAIGCAFGQYLCGEACYAQELMPWRMREGALKNARWQDSVLVVKENYAERFEHDLKAALSPRRSTSAPVRIFFGSATESCTPPLLEITRDVLRAVARTPPARFVLQTRSPAVVSLERELRAIPPDVLVVSLTIESDDDEMWKDVGRAMAPTISARRRALETIAGWKDVATSATVSPCSRLRDADGFATWIAEHTTFAVVDTYVAGDGSPQGGGSRTRSSRLPLLYGERGWDWRDERPARRLYAAVGAKMPGRVGWSAEGFGMLATALLGSSDPRDVTAGPTIA